MKRMSSWCLGHEEGDDLFVDLPPLCPDGAADGSRPLLAVSSAATKHTTKHRQVCVFLHVFQRSAPQRTYNVLPHFSLPFPGVFCR